MISMFLSDLTFTKRFSIFIVNSFSNFIRICKVPYCNYYVVKRVDNGVVFPMSGDMLVYEGWFE